MESKGNDIQLVKRVYVLSGKQVINFHELDINFSE